MLNFIKLRPEAFGLRVSDRLISGVFLERKNGNLFLKGICRQRIESGVVENGEIIDRKRLEELLAKFYAQKKEEGIKTNNAVCSIPESKTFTKTIAVPNLKKGELFEAVKWEAEANIPVSIEEVHMDWKIISESKDKISKKIFLAAAGKTVVDSYADVLEKVGFRIAAIETEPISLARAVLSSGISDSEAFLIIDLNEDKTIFVLYHENVIRFTSSAVENDLDFLKQEIKRALDFAKEHVVKSEDVKVILSGYSLDFENLAFTVSKELNVKIIAADPWKLISDPKNKKNSLGEDELRSFSVVLGLAIRGAALCE